MEDKKNCLVCGHEIKELYTFKNMPMSAQDIPTKEELSSDHPIDLRLCQCTYCGLVQFDTEAVSYYKDVIRAGGGSSTMHELRHDEYRRLLSFMEDKNIEGRNILEAGCGRGEFLKMWEDLPEYINSSIPIKLKGIEHKRDLVDIAKKEGLDVSCAFAEGDVVIPSAPFDAFCQFNFLEHQIDPLSMLRCIRANLKDRALGLITVPSFEYILKHDGYYEFIRDHIANYSEESLQYLLSFAGFNVLSKRIVNRDTIEMIVEKAKDIDIDDIKPIFNGEFIDVSGLMENYKTLNHDIDRFLNDLKKTGRKMAIWGAGHQGFTLAATTKLSGRISYIIDSAAFKQGKFSPASHIKIVEPKHFFKEPVDIILVVAPGYTDEIAGIIRDEYGKDIEILVLKTDHIEKYSLS